MQIKILARAMYRPCRLLWNRLRVDAGPLLIYHAMPVLVSHPVSISIGLVLLFDLVFHFLDFLFSFFIL